MGWEHGRHMKESKIFLLNIHVGSGIWLSCVPCFPESLRSSDFFLLTLFIEHTLGSNLHFYLNNIDQNLEYLRRFIEQKITKRKKERYGLEE